MEIIQDGIGRISKEETDREIMGLHTAGLQTCLAFIFVSEKGVSLVHATYQMSPESIVAEIKWHGGISFWAIAFNPDYYPNYLENDGFAEIIGKFYPWITGAAGEGKYAKNPADKGGFHKAVKGHITLMRAGEIDLENKPDDLEFLPKGELRHRLNIVNNFFTRADEDVPADFQFDGVSFTDMPPLYKNSADIEVLKRQGKFSSSPHLARLLREYETVKGMIGEKVVVSDAGSGAIQVDSVEAVNPVRVGVGAHGIFPPSPQDGSPAKGAYKAAYIGAGVPTAR